MQPRRERLSGRNCTRWRRRRYSSPKKAEKHRKLQDEAPLPQRRIVSENKKNEYLRKFERAAMLHAQLEECCRNATAQQQADAAEDPVVEVS